MARSSTSCYPGGGTWRRAGGSSPARHGLAWSRSRSPPTVHPRVLDELVPFGPAHGAAVTRTTPPRLITGGCRPAAADAGTETSPLSKDPGRGSRVHAEPSARPPWHRYRYPRPSQGARHLRRTRASELTDTARSHIRAVQDRTTLGSHNATAPLDLILLPLLSSERIDDGGNRI
jgi:hypothetical protein